MKAMMIRALDRLEDGTYITDTDAAGNVVIDDKTGAPQMTHTVLRMAKGEVKSVPEHQGRNLISLGLAEQVES